MRVVSSHPTLGEKVKNSQSQMLRRNKMPKTFSFLFLNNWNEFDFKIVPALFLPVVILYVMHSVDLTHPHCPKYTEEMSQDKKTANYNKKTQETWKKKNKTLSNKCVYFGCRCKRYFQNCWFWSETSTAPLFLYPRNDMEVPRRHFAML